MTAGTWYQNLGARFTAESGEHVGQGDIFQASTDDVVRRKHKLRPVARHEVMALGLDDPESEEAERESSDDAWPPPEWPLSTPPGPYLKRHPTGPHAEMARELLERRAAS